MMKLVFQRKWVIFDQTKEEEEEEMKRPPLLCCRLSTKLQMKHGNEIAINFRNSIPKTLGYPINPLSILRAYGEREIETKVSFPTLRKKIVSVTGN